MFGLLRTTILSLALAFGAGSVLAQDFQKFLAAYQDFQKGFAAYNAGDYATPLQEWRPLAEQGNADAQGNIGVMYDKGKGVLQDYAEAVKWYRLAAEQGDAKAQFNLAVMYYKGRGVLQDNIRSHMWSNISSANGLEIAREARQETEGEMSADVITKAQSMAKECMNSNYKNCGW